MKVLCFIGPSGSGKSAVVNELNRLGIITLNPSCTDRPIRNDEIGSEHVFLTKTEFDRLESNNEFLEVVKPFNLTYRYGLSTIQRVGRTVPTVVIRAKFIPLMLKYYPDLVIYQIEAPFEFSGEQVMKRGDNDTGTRLKDFESETDEGRAIAYRVFKNNGNKLNQLVEEILECIKFDFNSI